MSRVLTRKVRGVGLELERPEGGRIVARRGQPRVVLSGGAQELVLFVCGRQQVARISLSGADEAQQVLRDARFGI
jgi:hypothetical protein